MANEHEILFELEPAIPFTVANGTGIEKGAVLKGTDPMTAIITSAANDPVVGIARGEKVASDGLTKVAVTRRAIVRGTCSGSVTMGDPLVTDAVVNMLKTAPLPSTVSMMHIVGRSLETATTGQTFLYELNPYVVRHS